MQPKSIPGLLDPDFLAGDAPDIAPSLLGKILRVKGCWGRIIEVEAYTSDDPASHSRRGITPRNATMFAAPGTLYVYLIYGIHCCANIVTGVEGDGQAVLLRGVQPMKGVATMRRRRGDHPNLSSGPGRLCQAFGLDRRHDGLQVCDPHSPVQLIDDGMVPGVPIGSGPRIGISDGLDLMWRWWLAPENGRSR
jgi:DNA-3-methyladenine glycosylase